MPRIMVIDRFYMDRLYEGGEVYNIGEQTLAQIKAKKMTHHIQRLDKKDEEVAKAEETNLSKLTLADLRAKAEDLGIDHEGKSKAQLLEELKALTDAAAAQA